MFDLSTLTLFVGIGIVVFLFGVRPAYTALESRFDRHRLRAQRRQLNHPSHK